MAGARVCVVPSATTLRARENSSRERGNLDSGSAMIVNRSIPVKLNPTTYRSDAFYDSSGSDVRPEDCRLWKTGPSDCARLTGSARLLHSVRNGESLDFLNQRLLQLVGDVPQALALPIAHTLAVEHAFAPGIRNVDPTLWVQVAAGD